MSKEITIKKNNNFTVMSNNHFKETNMSLKAKGLLSQMLSLPPTWDYSVVGLSKINKDGRDSVRDAIMELEKFGYLKRIKIRKTNGIMGGTKYIVYEEPQFRKVNEQPFDKIQSIEMKETDVEEYLSEKSEENQGFQPVTAFPSSVKPLSVKPTQDIPTSDIPTTDKPTLDNRPQLNTKELSTKELSSQIISYPTTFQITDEYINNCFDMIRTQINYDSFDYPIEKQVLLDDIIKILVYEIYCADINTCYSIGETTKPISVIKNVFNNNLNYSIITTYINQLYSSGKPVINPSSYHIKGLYCQCLGQSTQMQSKYFYQG